MNRDWKSFWSEHVSKIGDDKFKQVGRTLEGQSMSREMFEAYANGIIDQLDLERNHFILDLCCGNGLLTTEIAKRGCQVLAVDFSADLINSISQPNTGNIIAIVADVLKVRFRSGLFDHIVMAAALQHFTFAQAIHLFQEMYVWLKPSGKLLITDITNSSKMWEFYNTSKREDMYFQDTLNATSPLGTWYDPRWLKKLARHSRFSSAQILDKSEDYWYSHYRFDLICYK